MNSTHDELVFVPLGGLGEIGMNAALYGFGPEDSRQWILVDCGMGFGGEEHLPGIEVVYPDLRFIEEDQKNLLGIFITGPLGFLAGAVGGAVWWLMQRRRLRSEGGK